MIFLHQPCLVSPAFLRMPLASQEWLGRENYRKLWVQATVEVIAAGWQLFYSGSGFQVSTWKRTRGKLNLEGKTLSESHVQVSYLSKECCSLDLGRPAFVCSVTLDTVLRNPTLT